MNNWRTRMIVALASFLVLLPAAMTRAAGFLTCSGATDCTLCAGVTAMQLLINGIIILAMPLIAVLIGWAGALLMTSGANPSQRNKALSMFKSIGIGFLFLLSGWLIVDTVIRVVIINRNPDYFKGSDWNSVSCSGLTRKTDSLVSQLLYGVFGTGTAGSGGNVNVPGNSGTTGWGVVNSGTVGTTLCDPSNTACNPETLQKYGWSETQAKVMSCIAVTESRGNPGSPPSSSGACGLFQVVPGNWARISPKVGCAGSSCNDATCNTKVAYYLSSKNSRSPYQDWTCAGCNAAAQKCVDTYGI